MSTTGREVPQSPSLLHCTSFRLWKLYCQLQYVTIAIKQRVILACAPLRTGVIAKKNIISPTICIFNILPTATSCPLNQFWWAKDVLDIQYPVNYYIHFARLVWFQNLSFFTAYKDNAPRYVVPYLSLPRTCWTAGEWEPTPPAGWGTSHHSSQPCSGSWSPGTWQGTPASAPHARTSSLQAVTALHWGKSRRGKQLCWVLSSALKLESRLEPPPC